MTQDFKKDDVYRFALCMSAKTKEKGGQLHFQSCPYCKGKGSGNEWTFAIDLETGQFNCLRASCGKSGNMLTLSHDFGFDLEQKETKKEFRRFGRHKELTPSEQAIEYLIRRGIPAEVTKRYQVTTRKDNQKILCFPFIDPAGEMVYIKYRKTDFVPGRDRNKEWSEANCKPILFGMHQCNPENRTLVLTEGQLDSMSVAAAGIENAVSVPNGAKGFTWFVHCQEWLKQFETLVIFGDHEHGHITLVEEMRGRFKGIVKVVRVDDYRDCKDANEILQKYGTDSVRAAVENAEPLPIRRIISLAAVQREQLTEADRISTGIYKLDAVLSGGFYKGQLVLITGKRGDGKSTLASQVLVNALNDGRVFVAYSGELENYQFRRWLDLQLAGKRNCIEKLENGYSWYRVPDTVREKIGNWYSGRAWLYDNTGINEAEELQDVLETIETAAVQYSADLVLLDNLMTVIDLSPKDDLYRAQSAFVGRLAKMAKRLHIVVILVVHPRKSTQGDANDQVAGSSDITNKADVVLSYGRVASDDNMRVLTVSKNRLTGKLATVRNGKAIDLYYDPVSKRIAENEDDFSRPYGWELDTDGFADAEQMEIPF